MLVEGKDKIKKGNLYFKEYVEFLEESNNLLKLETTNIRNFRETCETCVSLKREVTKLHKTLGKLTKEKENLDLILSSQRDYLNKSGIGFNPNKTPSK